MAETRSFYTTLERFNDSPIWGYYFPIDEEMAAFFTKDKDRRVICLINDQIETRSAIMPGKLGHFIMINQQTVKRLRLQVGGKVNLVLEKDNSEYGMEMPDELREMLLQDELGSKYFHELTPGKQRNLIYIVSKVKNTNSRINKALAIMHHLKEVQGALDFKMLNETIKYYNNL